MLPVIVNRHPPLTVMIGDEMRLAIDPSAASLTIGDSTEMLGHHHAPRNRYEGALVSRLRKNIVALENYNSLHVWPNRRTLTQDAQKGRHLRLWFIWFVSFI